MLFLWILDLSLEPKKTYEYKYVGLVNFGRGLPQLAESAVRLTCKVKIFSASAPTFMLQVIHTTAIHATHCYSQGW